VVKEKKEVNYLDNWASITGVCRAPDETDKELRIRVIDKLNVHHVSLVRKSEGLYGASFDKPMKNIDYKVEVM